MANLDGNEIATTVKRSQVWQATHDGEGKTLPYMNRSFISFTFGGKKIEDFDLIAVTDGDRLSRQGYANFSDITTSYDTLDGQYYWGTHYENNTMEFKLATDGIDQKMLDNFLHWFRAGATRELILAEHPNRAILARVSSPPQLDLLPFEALVEVKVGTNNIQTKTTLYKGEITLSLTMDEPHWYSILNILGIKDETNGRYIDKWHDVSTDQDVWIIESKDALKILYEDGIPLGSMIGTDMLLGDGNYASIEVQSNACIWKLKPEIAAEHPEYEDDPNYNTNEYGIGARIVADNATGDYVGVISGAFIDMSGNGITSLSKNDKAYFFYAGTAPAPTIISFTLTPQFNNDYIVVPRNSLLEDPKYNTITIESETKQELKFTTPNLFTSYNKVLEIFRTKANASYTWEDVRKDIRDNVRHMAVRAWANRVIESISGGDYKANAQANLNTLKTYMKILFTDSAGTVQPATFVFNSQTGEAIGTFYYRDASGSAPSNNTSSWNSYNSSSISNQKTENVGDMLKSNYIFIQDRNYPTSDGQIVGWNGETAEGKRWSHILTHNCDTSLTNLSIIYKNMYL